MIARDIFKPEHLLFRNNVKRFMNNEVVPNDRKWKKQGFVDKSLWKLAGDKGFLCTHCPLEFGGSNADKIFSMILIEEQAYANNSSLGFTVHSEIVAPYLLNYGSYEIKKKYLPKMANGEMIGAIGITEPSTGSDVKSIKTVAIKSGDKYIVNGSKTFITNGYNCDLVLLVVKTDPTKTSKGTSLLVIDTKMSGFTKGKPLDKIGLKGQDTCELFFQDVEVPITNLVGKENDGFYMLMKELPWERLQIAINAISKSEAAVKWTLDYIKNRKAFGKNLSDFQTIKFKLSELSTQIQITRVFIDKCMELLVKNKLDTTTASMAKYWSTELQCKVMDECLQLHGGYGYMTEYPISEAFVDARVEKIYGGTNEIMKELISRSLGLSSKGNF